MLKPNLVYIFLILFNISLNFIRCKDKLLIITIATEPTDGFKRFEQSLKAFDYKYEIIGMGEEWRGGDIKRFPGGGHKINLMKKHLEKYKDEEDLIAVFTDSYDVIATQSPENLMEKFKNSGARIIFGAEKVCWPDESLSDLFPEVTDTEKRFLNSGGIIGYMTDLYELITIDKVEDDDDDQFYFTKMFLNLPTREKYKMKLDTKSEIFQNINGAQTEMSLIFIENSYFIYNNLTENYPIFIHGNGPTKSKLNHYGNYIGNAFSTDEKLCKICLSDRIELKDSEKEKWPTVTIGVFIDLATPFMKEFFEKISNLNYPKSKITLLIYNNVKYHSKLIEDFFVDPKNEYHSIKYISPDDEYAEFEARSEAISECIENDECDFYFSLSPIVHLDNPNTLKLLIEENKNVLAPIMIKKGSVWSNIWGDINQDGFYKRSIDYIDIIERNTMGIFNLPYIAEAVLTKKDILKKIDFVSENMFYDASMTFAGLLRDKNIFMYGTNKEYFGHLIDTDNFDENLIRPEMYEIMNNFDDWTDRYVHKQYIEFLRNSSKALEPCTDVYWFPLVNDEFCEDLIVMMETFGEWSGGRSNYGDDRLPGGVENVPTVDIHMKQIGWDKHWMVFLEKIMQPMQQVIFPGYYNTPSALLSFVVRYRPGEQDHLKPHNDASTYTINIALNKPDIDFEGGGCRFLRRNCSVTKTKKGWAMMHPGRLTHFHEGLKVTKGTRYIMVTFIDP